MIRKTILSCFMAIGAMALLLGAAPAQADFVNKLVNCPKTGFNILPAGGRYSIDDIIISSDAVTDVTIRFNPPRIVILTAFMDANDTVVTNFQEEVETNDEQAIKVDCGGVATISVTLVGNGEL